MQIELIEHHAEHDLAATTDWLKMQLLSNPLYGLQQYADAVHFALTSENINGPAFGLMHQRLLQEIILPVIIGFQELCLERGERYLELPIVAFTHGQPAEPTTLGKEYLNIAAAVDNGLKKFLVRDEKTGERVPFRFTASMRGAVGNLSDHYAAYPSIDWRSMLDGVVASFGLEPVDMSDQCEPFSRYHSFANIVDEIAVPVLKFAEDFWLRVHDGVYTKKPKESHKGSTAMPQKKNPWLLEGGMAIMRKGIAQLLFTINDMRGYHQSGDISRSVLSRDIGDDYGKIVLGLKRIMREVGNYFPDEAKIQGQFRRHPEVAGGAVMTRLKAMDVKCDPYREIQQVSVAAEEARNGGRDPSAAYRDGLSALCEQRGLSLEQGGRILDLCDPKNNLGAAVSMGRDCIERCRATVQELKKLYLSGN